MSNGRGRHLSTLTFGVCGLNPMQTRTMMILSTMPETLVSLLPPELLTLILTCVKVESTEVGRVRFTYWWGGFECIYHTIEISNPDGGSVAVVDENYHWYRQQSLDYNPRCQYAYKRKWPLEKSPIFAWGILSKQELREWMVKADEQKALDAEECDKIFKRLCP